MAVPTHLQLDAILFQLIKGGDITPFDNKGSSVLFYTVEKCVSIAINLLLASGANILVTDIKDEQFFTMQLPVGSWMSPIHLLSQDVIYKLQLRVDVRLCSKLWDEDTSNLYICY